MQRSSWAPIAFGERDECRGGEPPGGTLRGHTSTADVRCRQTGDRFLWRGGRYLLRDWIPEHRGLFGGGAGLVSGAQYVEQRQTNL